MPVRFQRYQKDQPFSYSFGAFATIELLSRCPEAAREVCLHPSFRIGRSPLLRLCEENQIPLLVDERPFLRLSDKENVFVIGVFAKPQRTLRMDLDHIVLVNPGDMGNLGTILREAAGFGVLDVALLSGGADEWHPKTVRASMGACFLVRTQRFAGLSDYLQKSGKRDLFAFRLDGEQPLDRLALTPDRPISFIFGNEAGGLPPEYSSLGQGVVIRHSKEIDSLNLSVAVGIALFERSRLLFENS